MIDRGGVPVWPSQNWLSFLPLPRPGQDEHPCPSPINGAAPRCGEGGASYPLKYVRKDKRRGSSKGSAMQPGAVPKLLEFNDTATEMRKSNVETPPGGRSFFFFLRLVPLTEAEILVNFTCELAVGWDGGSVFMFVRKGNPITSYVLGNKRENHAHTPTYFQLVRKLTERSEWRKYYSALFRWLYLDLLCYFISICILASI